MKKAVSIIAFFAILLLSASAYTDNFIDAVEGSTAPVFAVTNDSATASVDKARGKYLLLNFWSSSDASSRIRCNQYEAFARAKGNDGHYTSLSVNFDRSENLFKEIVRIDGMNAKTQFFVQGEKAAKLISDYHLEDGYQSFLIDPEGRIIAKNPSTTLLTKLVSH